MVQVVNICHTQTDLSDGEVVIHKGFAPHSGFRLWQRGSVLCDSRDLQFKAENVNEFAIEDDIKRKHEKMQQFTNSLRMY